MTTRKAVRQKSHFVNDEKGYFKMTSRLHLHRNSSNGFQENFISAFKFRKCAWAVSNLYFLDHFGAWILTMQPLHIVWGSWEDIRGSLWEKYKKSTRESFHLVQTWFAFVHILIRLLQACTFYTFLCIKSLTKAN